jgi:hypothetical protein
MPKELLHLVERSDDENIDVCRCRYRRDLIVSTPVWSSMILYFLGECTIFYTALSLILWLFRIHRLGTGSIPVPVHLTSQSCGYFEAATGMQHTYNM